MINDYRALLNDAIRIEAFRKAINDSVREGDTVAEIGAALGTYSFFAADAGASQVYAVEDSSMVHVGREISRQNGYDKRVKFIKGHSLDVQLPEPVDWIIMEDFSPFFLYEGLPTVIRDASMRWLKPDGNFIPMAVDIICAPCSCETYYNTIHLWRNTDDEAYGINWGYTTELALNRMYKVGMKSENVPFEPFRIKTLNLKELDSFNFSKTHHFTADKNVVIHGLLGWFDARFTPDFLFPNSPYKPYNTWGQMFFPFREPVQVTRGTRCTVELRVFSNKADTETWVKWKFATDTVVFEGDTFRGQFLSFDDLARRDLNYQPSLTAKGEIHRIVLNLIAERKRSTGELIDLLVREYGLTESVAIRYMNTIMERYC